MNAVVQPNTEPMLLRQDADGVATITLNRPGQFNALSAHLSALLAELEAVAPPINPCAWWCSPAPARLSVPATI